MRRKVLILGAAGRDFHNFNVFFRDNEYYEVVGFTATQIPNISNRRYPPELAGKLYPKGIPIYDESELEKLLEQHSIEWVYFSYSDVSHEYVMHLASRCQAMGASFVLLGPNLTQLKSGKKVIAVTAVRTGAGKSTLSRAIAGILKRKGVRFAVVRHPMPYGDLARQACQRFASLSDLEKAKCTIEEREEYEPHIRSGAVVFAGVDYGKVLEAAEKEADVILWDGGNNDMPFIRPDLHLVIADALRPGHEMLYYPGESNFRSADIIVINKTSENPMDARRIAKNAEKVNPRAKVLEADSELLPDSEVNVFGKKAVVVEDGPTVTHGGMRFGAGFEFAYAPGPVTNLALVNVGGTWRLIVAEGESIAIKPRPVSAPQMLFKPKKLGIAGWCNGWLKAGAPHHMALAYGHLADKLRKVAELGGWDYFEV